jgi:hypothetical protein
MDPLSMLIDWAATSPAVPWVRLLTLSAVVDHVRLQAIHDRNPNR